MSIINTPEDLQWLADVHGVDVSDVVVAIISGNEDDPDKVETYTQDDVRQRPITWLRNSDGQLIRQ